MKKNIRWDARYKSYLDEGEMIRNASRPTEEGLKVFGVFLRKHPDQWFDVRLYKVTEILDEKDCPVSVKYEEII